MVSVRHDIQTIMYSEIGKMHITDPVRDVLAFIGSSAETKSVSAVCGMKGCVVGKIGACGIIFLIG